MCHTQIHMKPRRSLLWTRLSHQRNGLSHALFLNSDIIMHDLTTAALYLGFVGFSKGVQVYSPYFWQCCNPETFSTS